MSSPEEPAGSTEAGLLPQKEGATPERMCQGPLRCLHGFQGRGQAGPQCRAGTGGTPRPPRRVGIPLNCNYHLSPVA